MPMKELVEATGLPRSTILYYLREGLLPEPVKTSPNMAYYDPQCVDRIRFIRHAKTRHRLSMSEIRELLRKHDGETPPWFTLDELIFDPPPDSTCNEQAFCAATGLDPSTLHELLEARLLLPLEQRRFDSQDMAVGTILAQALQCGMSAHDCRYYPELAGQIVDREMALRHRVTHHLSPAQNTEVTGILVRLARALRPYIIDRLFQRRVASMTGPNTPDGGDHV